MKKYSVASKITLTEIKKVEETQEENERLSSLQIELIFSGYMFLLSIAAYAVAWMSGQA